MGAGAKVKRIYWREDDDASWKRVICKVLGHYDGGGHPHAAFCGRCGMIGDRLREDGSITYGYPNDSHSVFVRGRLADGVCTHKPGEHGPAGCFDLFAHAAGMIKGDDGRYRFRWEHLQWIGVITEDEAIAMGKVPR